MIVKFKDISDFYIRAPDIAAKWIESKRKDEPYEIKMYSWPQSYITSAGHIGEGNIYAYVNEYHGDCVLFLCDEMQYRDKFWFGMDFIR